MSATPKIRSMTASEKLEAYNFEMAEALRLGATKEEVEAFVRGYILDVDECEADDDRSSEELALEAISWFVVRLSAGAGA